VLPVTGRQSRRWHRCESRGDADRVARDLTRRSDQRTRSGTSLTLREYLVGWWLPAVRESLAPSTHARYVTCVEHYLLTHLGDTPLGRLRPEHFEVLYRRPRMFGSRRCGPLGAKTVLNLHRVVRVALRAAVAGIGHDVLFGPGRAVRCIIQ
jgi:hypothetical protein